MQTLVVTSMLLLCALSGQNEATLLPILSAIKGKLLSGHRGIHQGTANTFQFADDGFEGGSETRMFQTSFTGDDEEDTGVQILRREAPLIQEIEVKINEGLEAERDLESVREEIRRELVEAKKSGKVGGIQRSQMESRIRQLDRIIGQLRQKNLEAQRRFTDVISGIKTGRIRSQRMAHGMLGGLEQFYTDVVMGYVRTSLKLCMGIVNFWLGLFGKFTGMAG
uniref:Putative secreted protein n=1 Tax=Rhipicephalus microplus TaxID=6941 RepID=A0A6G5A7P7_RHIMP